MNRQKTILRVVLSVCIILSLFTGCKKETENESSVIYIEDNNTNESSKVVESSVEAQEESSEQAVQESSVPAVEEDPALKDIVNDPNMNPLTGEVLDHAVSSKRPVAFSINNHPDAVPAVGVGEADIIYEAIIEGGATRMLAIYQEIPDDIVIGSIRSLRHNYIDFAACYDAIIAHCGSSNLADDALIRRDYNDIDAISWAGYLFYRDSWRDSNMGYVHSLVTTGEEINNFLKNDAPYRVEHDSDYQCNMVFSTNPIVSGGSLMTDIDVFFGDYRHTLFTFDAATNDYTAEEYDMTYIDQATGEPVRFKNLVVIRTDVWVCDGVHQDMTLTGDGEGYFCVNGVCAEIDWHRDSEDSQFVFTYKDGSPVIFGVGTTYIAVVDLEGGIS